MPASSNGDAAAKVEPTSAQLSSILLRARLAEAGAAQAHLAGDLRRIERARQARIRAQRERESRQRMGGDVL